MTTNNEFFTQDIDIMPDNTDVSNDAVVDIIPDSAIADTENITADEVITNDVESTEGDNNTEEADKELEELLKGVTDSTEEVSDKIDEAGDKVEEIKDKVEEVQENPESSTELLKEIYQDLLETETALQATEIAKGVALSKVAELQAQVSELEINAAGQYQTDNPDLMIINKLYSAAEGGSDIATPKVKDALNKIYLGLFNTSIEEGQVQDNLEGVNDTSGVSLNEATLPAGKIEEEQEDVDINDVTAILG